MIPSDPAEAVSPSAQSSASYTEILDVGGMDCASCAGPVENALRKVAGVTGVQVNTVTGKVRIAVSESGPGRVQLAHEVRRLGFTVADEPNADNASAARIAGARPRGRVIAAMASGLALVGGIGADYIGGSASLSLLLLGIATIAGGWFVAPRGLRAVINRSLDMNFLMTVAAAGAWIIGEQAEAAATLFLFAVAEWLEGHAMDRARNAIEALMSLSPLEARVIREGKEMRIPVAEVRVGEAVTIFPGEKIPVDGEVISGTSSVDQAPITGESIPVDKQVGSEVFAGSLNGQGLLTARSMRVAADSTIARIIHAVESAQASRAPTALFVDRFAHIYTPVVVLGALVLAIVPPLMAGGEWSEWIYRALTMLVVACPCALVISTPVTFVSGLTGAARNGILIKGGSHLENLARVSVLAIDKTGTLSAGHPVVTDVLPFDGVDEAGFLEIAVGLERSSEHPLARAIVSFGERRGVKAAEATSFESLPGQGARATVTRFGETVSVFAGNKRMAEHYRFATPRTLDALQMLEGAGKTPMAFAVLRQSEADAAPTPIGIIAIADEVRPEAADALRGMRGAGVTRVPMLTGDNEGAANAIALQLGISEVHASLLPHDKVRIVNELKSGGLTVAFVGDGVNDAPALATANVGIAMGAAGTDVALETADVALMGDDLTKIPIAMGLARKTLAIVRQNIAVSLVIKAVFVFLTLGGWATLWLAVAADMGGSLGSREWASGATG